jgi:hypothetical protein
MASRRSGFDNLHIPNCARMATNTSVIPQSFFCGDCGRSYRTKDSLTRHRHNHDESNLHVCPTCSLTFARSDVLSRHVRIHHKGRKRSPRACIYCKAAKIKCDAGIPCSRCATASQTCKYESDFKERSRDQALRQHGIRRRTLSSGNTHVSSEITGNGLEPKPIHEILTNCPEFAECPTAETQMDPLAPATYNTILGDISTPPDVQQSIIGASKSENSLDVQTDTTDLTYSKWWATNPWLHSVDLPWLNAESIQQLADIGNNDFLDVSTHTFSHSASTFDSLSGLEGMASTALPSTYVRHNNIYCNVGALNNARRCPDLVLPGFSLFDPINEFRPEPLWLSNCNTGMSYRKFTSPNCLFLQSCN